MSAPANTLEYAVSLFQVIIDGPLRSKETYDNACRVYESIKQSPNNFIGLHIQVLQHCENVTIRLQCITSFKTGLLKGESNSIFDKLSIEVRLQLSQTLLQLANLEHVPGVLKGYSNILASIYNSMQRLKMSFPSLHDAVFQWVVGDEEHRVMAFNLLTHEIVPSSPKEEQALYVSKYVEMIRHGLSQNALSWIKDSFKLFTVVVLNFEFPSDIKNLFVFFPLFLEKIKGILSLDSNETERCDILGDVTELFLNQNIELVEFIAPCIQMCSDISLNQATHVDVRYAAFDTLIAICEGFPKEIKKSKELEERVLVVVINWLMTVKITNEWLVGKEDDEDLDMYTRAISGLDTLYTQFGTSNLLNYIFQQAQRMAQSAQWQERNTLLNLLFHAYGRSKKTLLKVTDYVMNILTVLKNDDCPRNIYLIIVIIDKIFKIESEEKKAMMIQSVMNVIGDCITSQYPKIVSRTCDLLCSILNLTESQILSVYYPRIVPILQILLRSVEDKIVSEAACALSYVVIKMEDKFAPFFEETLKALVESLKHDDFNVKGRVIECLSVVAMTLKGDYCEKCTCLMLNELNMISQRPGIRIEDSLFGFVETSFSRVAEIMGSKFAPYLPSVVNLVLQRAQMSVIGGSFEDEKEDKEVEIGNKRIAVHTAISEEKRNAVRTIADFAKDLDVVFLPFALRSFEVILPLVKDVYDEGLRERAGRCVVNLIQLLKNSRQLNQQIQMTCVMVFIYQIKHESYVVTTTSLLNNFEDVLSAFRDNTIGDLLLRDLVEMMGSLYTEDCQRIRESFAKTSIMHKDEEEDDEDEEKITEEAKVENQFRGAYVSFYKMVCQTQPLMMYTVFSTVMLPMIMKELKSGVENIIVTMFSENILVETASILNQTEMMQELMVLFIHRLEKGGLVEFTLDMILKIVEFPAMKNLISSLVVVLQPILNIKEKNLRCYEAAVLCMGKCFVQSPELFKESDVLVWLSILPLQYFADGCVYQLFVLVAKGMLKVNESVMKRIMEILILTFGKDDKCFKCITRDTVQYYLQLWNTKENPLFISVFSQFTPDNQQLLESLCRKIQRT
ncbi:hypothetical protein EIN_184190 [Entamoeba invadens IP1]|uniref:hypothetical protein n=1 Tax=Entamoeba invadens IP1 TaxID=370355 RepID=UPI0002C3DF89|nr:hypothetical protein EIN_184190 [Entamoeba invadens IP1]ELP94082.1 hypothetical protein EIN_184190 [Entamoeba invadens IP1]|eukprot:XP_004260853.1 hypothetical protein EIN_184190 [Entamoeba invadens IP1]